MAAIPVALTIAGSDSSAGAGLQADLKSFAANGVYGLCAVTCVVAEIPGAVDRVDPLPPGAVSAQLETLFRAFPIAAAKTGMLFNAAVIEETCAALEATASRPILVVDPVMVATSGDRLLEDAAVQVMVDRLLPMALLVTPNLDEASAFLGASIGSLDELHQAGEILSKRWNTAVLMKGGHLPGETATDVLCDRGHVLNAYSAPFLRGIPTHGTGCTFSAAITALLARGFGLDEACEVAKRYLHSTIVGHHRWNNIHALNHFPTV